MRFTDLTAGFPRLALLSSALLVSAALQLACGGSGAHNNSTTTAAPASNSAGNNVQQIVVNAGPAHNYANGVFTSLTVCVPSSSTCQTIDGILVDTGSYGLRLLSSAGGGSLTLSLPQQNGPDGNPVAECAGFVSGFTWGPVKTADITIAGEHANAVPIQVIDPTFSAIPSQCADNGVPADNTISTLGANGILGIGPYLQDCGLACEQSGSANPGLYYECASSTCHVIAQSSSQQVQNPVGLFASDNNGVIIELPALTGSTSSLTGSMIFGIGTQSNNALGASKIFPLNAAGEFSTTINGHTYPAFVDSGSNALFFLDAGTTGLTVCSDNSGFYCPSSQANLTATTVSGNITDSVPFSVVSADKLFSSQGNFVFAPLAGPNPGMFDWGLPFFFGRNVYTAIESRSTPAGRGPFWAY